LTVDQQLVHLVNPLCLDRWVLAGYAAPGAGQLLGSTGVGASCAC